RCDNCSTRSPAAPASSPRWRLDLRGRTVRVPHATVALAHGLASEVRGRAGLDDEERAQPKSRFKNGEEEPDLAPSSIATRSRVASAAYFDSSRASHSLPRLNNRTRLRSVS